MKKQRRRRRKQKPRPRQVPIEELSSIVARAAEVLEPEEHEKLQSAIETLAFLTREIEAQGASIRRLRRLLFGSGSEKSKKVLGQDSGSKGKDHGPRGGSGDTGREKSGGVGGEQERSEHSTGKSGKRPGHGRNGASAYVGALKVRVTHPEFGHKDRCPHCQRGKLYSQAEPGRLLRVVGMAPLSATVYELQRLRCNLCGDVLTAPAPAEVGEKKYDETVPAMLGLLRYGCGFPFNRLQWLEASLGIPMPSSTQWELVRDAAQLLEPVHAELLEQAAQGDVLHNDDTTMKLLNLERPKPETHSAPGEGKERSGTFTTGIVSTGQGRQIALFFTGARHAGENLAEVLKHRQELLPKPIQMCDALSRNTSGDFETIVANCLAHGRRRFVDVAHSFPDECRFVLDSLGQVYHHDAQAREQGLSAQERLEFHQEHSSAVMQQLHDWLQEQFEHKKVEPNSQLGGAIKYMLKHWSKLTLFLQKPGAPLDNNICERALKKAIRHRKNSLFYKTKKGAWVGDLFMSLIFTAELCGANPFEYLVALQRQHQAVVDNPSQWMPWNWQETLERLKPEPVQPMHPP